MTCTNSAEWLESGTAQLDAAGITGAARTQARLTLQLSNPFQPEISQSYTGPINKQLPYFIMGDGGCPQLVIPATAVDPAAGETPQIKTTLLPSPSSPAPVADAAVIEAPPRTTPPVSGNTGAIFVPPGTPCPEGFVEGSGAPQTLEQQVQAQLTATSPRTASQGGGCSPQIILAPQQMVSKNDFVVVSASSTFAAFGSNTGTVPLTVVVKLLTCEGSIQVMQSTLNLTYTVGAGAVQGEICIPLTDGYLISVVASGAPFCTQPGEVWVQGEIRNQSCKGTPAFPLFSGYLVDQSFIAWPGGRQDTWGQGNGALHGFDMTQCNPVNPCFVPDQGTRVRILQIGLDFTTSAAPGNRVPVICWNPPVNGCDLYFGTPVAQPPSKHYYWTWADGIASGSMLAGVNTTSGSGLLDAIVQVPLPLHIIGTGDAELRFLIANRDFAGDVINFAGVNYEVWTEPVDSGF